MSKRNRQHKKNEKIVSLEERREAMQKGKTSSTSPADPEETKASEEKSDGNLLDKPSGKGQELMEGTSTKGASESDLSGDAVEVEGHNAAEPNSDDQTTDGRNSDVKVVEVDIIEGQEKGKRRTDRRDDRTPAQIDITVVNVTEDEAPKREKELKKEEKVLIEEEKASEGEAKETDWREDLAYLESENQTSAHNQGTDEPASPAMVMNREEKKQADQPHREGQKANLSQTADTGQVQGETREGLQPKKRKKRDVKKRKQHVRLIKCVIAAALILAVVGVSAVLYQRYAPTTERMETQEYYTWMLARARDSDTADVSLNSGELVDVLQDEVIGETALYVNDQVYLNYDMVREDLYTGFYWDESIGRMLHTTADDTWQFTLDEAEYTTSEGTQTADTAYFMTSGEEKYVNADFLAQYVNITVEAYPEENHVLVTTAWGERQSATLTGNTALRFGTGIKELVLKNLRKNDTVYVLAQSTDGSWERVLTEDGYIGWVTTKRLTETQTVTTSHEFTAETIPSQSLDDKVNLVWHQISNEDANKYFTSDTVGTSGINVISPTWFSLIDNEGNFSSYASKSYVTKAHNKGLQVWALVDNFSENMSTATLTASYEARSTLISNLIDQALELEIDGINIDFETISESTGYSYVQFMRELSVQTRANNLILSVDVPVPMSYNTYYDRAELGRYCDYVIMMGYDEHYSGSEAGSVASLSFEETGIRDSITAGVPADKLVSAIPFYTRLWYSTTSDDGTETVWSEVYGMNSISTTLDTYSVETTWDETTQQNYAEWTLDDGTLCRIWVEDETSIALKAGLVDTYALGGIAEWALGYERDTIWPVITENIS